MNTLVDINGILDLGELVANNPAYKSIMADGIVTDEELKAQAEAAVKSLRRLQEICNEEQQSAIADAISDMAVLLAVFHTYELQDIRR